MTMRHEQKRALERAGDFLFRMISSERMKRIPSDVRREAAMILRHYPVAVEIKWLYEEKPKMPWQKKDFDA